MRTTRIGFTTLFLLLATQRGFGQVMAYDHRSTELGDYMAGQAELYIGQGIYLQRLAAAQKLNAEAAREWVKVAQDAMELRYRSARLREADRQSRRDARRQREIARQEQLDEEAAKLANDIRRGVAEWPVALNQTPNVRYVRYIEDVVRRMDGRPGNLQPEEVRNFRRATDWLRDQARNSTLSFHDRTKAVHCLNLMDRMLKGVIDQDMRLAAR